MDWFLSELEKGEGYPKKIYWPQEIDAFIPISNDLIIQPTLLPERKSVQLYWRKVGSNIRNPLVWINNKGEQGCAIGISKWIEALKYESYRSEHKKPTTAKIPINYHYVPEKIRFYIISAVLRLKHYLKLNKTKFPVSQLNGGCEILLGICNARWDLGNEESALILTHDIETEYGFEWVERIAMMEEQFGFRSMWNIIPRRYDINRVILNSLLDKGHEIGLHGIWHNNREAFLTKEQMRGEFYNLKSFISEFKIKGYRSPAWFRTKRMYDVLSEFFSYDLSCLDNDLICPAGEGGVGFMRPFRFKTGLIELPCTLPFESPLYWGVSSRKLTEYWKPKMDFINVSNGMLLVTTHPDPNYLGSKEMVSSYEKLLGVVSTVNWHNMLPRDIGENFNYNESRAILSSCQN